jgi:hypothetical protein
MGASLQSVRDNPLHVGYPAPAPWWAGLGKTSSPDFIFSLFYFSFLFEKFKF